MIQIDPNSVLYTWVEALFASKGVKNITEIWSRPSCATGSFSSIWSARDYHAHVVHPTKPEKTKELESPVVNTAELVEVLFEVLMPKAKRPA